MRLLAVCFRAFAICLIATGAAQAAPANLYPWYLKATAERSAVPATKLAAPDFILAPRSRHPICSHVVSTKPWEDGVQFAMSQLLAYDRKHGVALVMATTDVCNVALFEAPRPPVHAANGDLSRYRTVRGLRIGSSYARVLSIYGGRRTRHRGRLVLAYSATVPEETVGTPHQIVQLPQRITLVLKNDRVTSILIAIQESARF